MKVMYFSTDWCAPCKRLLLQVKEIYPQTKICNVEENMVLVQHKQCYYFYYLLSVMMNKGKSWFGISQNGRIHPLA